MEVSSQLHALAALPPGKEPLVPLAPRAGLDTEVKRKIPSPCRDSNQEIPRLLWNPKVYYRVHKDPASYEVLCDILTSCFVLRRGDVSPLPNPQAGGPL